MPIYQLHWHDQDLGMVDEVGEDSPWMSAAFFPTPAGLAMRDFFDFMVDEDRSSVEPPFDEALLDEENWWLVEVGGARRGIGVPAVYLGDRAIAWRWR